VKKRSRQIGAGKSARGGQICPRAKKNKSHIEGGKWKRFQLGDVVGMLLGGQRMQQPTINGSGESD
jgi:hypothetical protein